MQLTNTKRAILGATVVLILGAMIAFRNGGRAFTQRDYLLVGAALLLVTMNIIGSYYFDRKAAQPEKPKKKKK